MKVKDLIKKLQQTGLNNEVRLSNEDKDKNTKDFTELIYVSYDDNGDVVLYQICE